MLGTALDIREIAANITDQKALSERCLYCNRRTGKQKGNPAHHNI